LKILRRKLDIEDLMNDVQMAHRETATKKKETKGASLGSDEN
jgi:hypothetical protein